jgi:hypothetical protein
MKKIEEYFVDIVEDINVIICRVDKFKKFEKKIKRDGAREIHREI